jgi:hypothetical protein
MSIGEYTPLAYNCQVQYLVAVGGWHRERIACAVFALRRYEEESPPDLLIGEKPDPKTIATAPDQEATGVNR